ncbi:MAG: hypothetical protein TREMPRED_003728 [Tremellales sp. Tagirdzhanova-0007]|nr:MAG: hypothetical protein TREMPRED_003728 [Tremellales sp. Tagirdzhanova-0007]
MSFDELSKSTSFEPHVLTNPVTDDLLPIMGTAENGPMDPGRPHVKQISVNPMRPVFVIMQPKPNDLNTVHSGSSALSRLRTLLLHHPSEVDESTVTSLYSTRIHPALPILPKSLDADTPPNLQAAILATALSLSESTRSISALGWSLVEIDSPVEIGQTLADMAATLLQLGARTANTNRSDYMLLAKTIAQAQISGLHLNPLEWNIPAWEQELRIRLWWSLAIEDAWMSFLNSRPCHIQPNNDSVPIPSLCSVLEASCAFIAASSDSASSFISSCELAQLVRRLQAEVCTVGGVTVRSASERRDQVVEINTLADQLFDHWKDSVLGLRPRPTGVTSFLLQLLGFRCMLKRIYIELDVGLGAMFTPGDESLLPFEDFVMFIGRWGVHELDGYWSHYTSHILSSVTSSLIRLALASPTSPPAQATDHIARLVSSLNFFRTTTRFDIVDSALERASAVAARLRNLGEQERLCQALQGSVETMLVDEGQDHRGHARDQDHEQNQDHDQDHSFSPASQSLEDHGDSQASNPLESQFVWDWNGLDWKAG